MDQAKRSRAPNRDNTEKALLKELVKDDLKVIETKLTDTNSNKAKSKAWQKVHNRFQELNTRKRTLVELKQQWRCMKLEAKKSISVHRQAVQQTGGGSEPPSPSNDAVEILEMIPLEFEVDHNEFDSDYLLQSTGTTQDAGSWRETLSDPPPSMTTGTIVQPNLSSEVQDVSLLPISYDKPSSSKKGKGKRTQLFEDNQTKLVIQSLAEKRSKELLQQQEAEHQQRMANLQREMEMKTEQHEEKMRCIREEREWKKEEHEWKKEEHELKKEMLLLKKKKLLGLSD